MNFEVHEKEIKQYKKLIILGEIIPIKERIKLFEKKYGLTFDEFEKKVASGEENYEKWDDYIEWKAYHFKLEELKKSLIGIDHGRITVT